MRVWLDDIRPMPEGFDVHVQSAKEAIKLIESKQVKLISLDHDLGDVKLYGTGYDVALFIESAAFVGRIPRLEWRLHTQNPVGAKNMKAALEVADRYWDKIEHLYDTAHRARSSNPRMSGRRKK